MARFGDGLAVDPDLRVAAESATAQALATLDGVPPDLVCVFVSGDDPDLVTAAGVLAGEHSGGQCVIGCSAGGVIGAGRGVEATPAVSVWAGVLPGASVRGFSLETTRTPRGMAVTGLPQPEPDDRFIVLLADPYSFPADGFVQRSNDALDVPIVGGLASGTAGPGSTRLFLGGRPVAMGAVGAVLGGEVTARSVVSQGCRPIGPEMIVTAAAGNVVLELAGTPALVKLQEIVDEIDPLDRALVEQGLQLGIVMDEYAETHEQGDFVVRGIAGADQDRMAIVVGDLVDVGRTVRFHVRDAGAADADLDRVLERLRQASGWTDVGGALLFSCNGRGRTLFPTADHDVEAVRRALQPVGVGGFFAGGEIGPVAGRNYVHGFSASILAFEGR